MDDIFNFYDLILTPLISWSCSFAIIFGGVVPYLPQYQEIRQTENTEGFSTYVCLALLIANILRILFWFGKRFELPLLAQSIVMNATMLVLMHMCVKVRNKNQIVVSKSRVFLDFDWRFFWKWSDFLSYIEFLTSFTTLCGLFLYFCLNIPVFIEAMGFLALLVEAMLGVPQFYRNFRNKSTLGMSIKMVLMWTMGDMFKTGYFLIREAPMQFWICGFLQVTIDFCILFQVFLYRKSSRHKPSVF